MKSQNKFKGVAILVAALSIILLAGSALGSQWEWMHPYPTAQNIRGAWMDSSGHIFAVGDAGLILHHDGNAWEQMESGTTEILRGVWGLSPTGVFAVGDGGTILYYNGIQWVAYTTNTNADLRGVWSDGGGNVYAVGANSTILKLEGVSWIAEDIGDTTAQFNAIWGSGSDNIFAVGSGGTIIQYNGTAWSTPMVTGSTAILNGVWGAAADNVFAVGTGGTILRYTGGVDWLPMNSGTVQTLNNVYGFDGSDVSAVGTGGTVLFYNGVGNDWTTQTGVPTTEELFCMTGNLGLNPTRIVGRNGTILKFTGSWEMETIRLTQAVLTDVWGASENAVFAVGEDETILFYNGTDWSLSNVNPGGEQLNDVSGNAANNVYSVGNNGKLLHYNGSWSAVTDISTTAHLNGVWVSPNGEVFIVGTATVGNAVILHYTGSNWEPQNSGTTYLLEGVWGASETEVYAVGQEGTILKYDGNSWTPMNSGTTYWFVCIWGNSGNDVYAVAGSSVYHYDGNADNNWTLLPGFIEYPDDLWGTASNNLYAVGGSDYDVIGHYDGNSWSEHYYPIFYPSGIWGSSASNIFVVGYSGMILRYRETTAPLSQREALIALYNATDGDNWTDNSSWKGINQEADGFSEAGTECTWFGVNCDISNNIIVIDLDGNNLVGTIPASISVLSNLQGFEVDNNQITGAIPPELGSLSNLEWLHLTDNDLSGIIPTELGHLSSLHRLWLGSNQLNGTIPPELGSLSNLQELRLGRNQLTGSIPTEFSNLSNLQKLWVNHNQLSGPVPFWINDLPLLEQLDLGYNQFSETVPPPAVGDFPSLTFLSLHSNQLTGTIPAELANLSSLETLYLASNDLTGSIPPEIGSMSTLKDIYFQSNQLTGAIPPELGNLPNLGVLYLPYNQLSGAIPPELGNLTNLFSLYLSNNQLTGTIPKELGDITSLMTIDLSNNQLTGTIPSELSSLANLVLLSLRGNQLTGSIPTWVGAFSNLQYLQLTSNLLSGAIPGNLGSLTNLQQLMLEDNQLSGPIPSELGGLVSLQYLRLRGNQLSGPIPSELKSLTSLLDGSSYLTYNALYTSDSALTDFLNTKESSGDWESTQTVAPANLAAGSSTETSITLTWSPIVYQTDTGGYEVEYSEAPGGPYTQYETTADKAANSWTVTGLTPATPYYFRVRTFTNNHVSNQNAVYSEYTSDISGRTSVPLDTSPDPPTPIDGGIEDEAAIPEGGPFELKTSAYHDPDGDSHTKTHWEVWRFDTDSLLPSYPVISTLEPELVLHDITDLLEAGLKYGWRVGYEDEDANVTWSEDYFFKVGTPEPDTLPTIAAGASLGDFGMISIVHWPNDPDPQAVFNIDYDPNNFRIGAWDPEEGHYIEFGNGLEMEPGRAVWILTRDPLVVNFNGIPVSMKHYLELCLHTSPSTNTGYNMVAPPNGADYLWSELEVGVSNEDDGIFIPPVAISELTDDSIIDRKVWEWSDGEYHSYMNNTSFVLKHYKGYWVKAMQKGAYLVFPVHAQVAGLSTPGNTMLALKGKTVQWFKSLVPQTNAAIADSDTPPMPMGLFEDSVDPVFEGCFIESTESMANTK